MYLPGVKRRRGRNLRGNALEQAGEGRWSAEEVIRHALVEAGGSPIGAGRLLGIARPTFWYYLRRYGLGRLPAQIRAQLRGQASGTGIGGV